jgi:hypothetical protein
MPSQTSSQSIFLRRLSEAPDDWQRVGQYDPESIPSVQAEIESLRTLAPNWDGYGALPIDAAVIDAAKTFIGNLPDDLAFRPHVAPLSNGTLQMEWENVPKSLELEFVSPHSIRYLQWHPEEGLEEVGRFPVRDIETAADLIRWCMSEASK